MRLRRSPALFWTAAVAVALLTGITVSGLVGQAADRAAALGGLRSVPVAARPVAAGATLEPADVALRRLPGALLPDAPVADSPTGRVALVDLADGEVLLAARLAPEGVEGIAALLPEGMRALAVPADAAGMALRRGHRVDVLATFDSADPTSEPTVTVAVAALVLDVGEDAVTVAVTPSEAPRLAFAMARGIITLALTTPSASTSTEPRSRDARFPGMGAASSGARP